MSGSNSQGTSLSATLGIAPGAKVANGTTTYDTSTLTLALYAGGTLVATGVTTLWQSVGTPYWAFSFSTADKSCRIRTGGSSLPTTAAVGTTGPFLNGTEYPGCNPSNMPRSGWLSTGAVTTTWTYSDINGTGFACFNTSNAGLVGTETESDCVEVIDKAGTLGTHVRITVKDLNGVVTTLTN